METVEKPSKYAVRQWLAQRQASRLPLPDLADIVTALRAQAQLRVPAPDGDGYTGGSGEVRHG
ncbi:MAG: hypothetical protein V4724_28955 [Pseudomonadota bacterium]